MIGRLSLWMVCGVLLATSVGTSSAKAQLFGGGGGYGLGFFNYGNSSYMEQKIPYYALYPPVYYSYPVARTYGHSPFAYPPGTRTPEIEPKMEAATYLNPYVPHKLQPAAKKPALDKSVSIAKPARHDAPVQVARTYHNPYVVQAALAGKEALTARVEH
jgi:hypothetical protein